MPQFITRDNQCPSLSGLPFQDKLVGPETQADCSDAPKAKKVVLEEFTAWKLLKDDAPQPHDPIGRFG